jgi:hypothetical protein
LTSGEKSLAGAAAGRALAALRAEARVGLAPARDRAFGALFAAAFATGLESFLEFCLLALAALRGAFFMIQNSSSH